MDPSQRLMLEVAYEAFENSGLPIEEVRGTNTSCYVGQFVSDYREMLFRDAESAPTYTVTGTGTSLISNRISWFFDLKGPSFTINTACSSSMVALHEGCESLRRGESNMSIIGGSNLILSPEMFTYLRNQGFLAPDGKCKTFDATANGYGRGEGVAALVIMPVEDAIRQGHPIRAVIRGTGVNQNGRTKSIVMPSAEAQMSLIEKTYQSAGLTYGETTYVETHGTGTQVGDRLELEAIGRTLAHGRKSRKRLLVGSSKPNIGHTEATAGLAGVIKGILALESGLIPPNIYFHAANPTIPFDEWAVSVPTQLTAWPSQSLRRMSACSTGYSGTNAHVVLDDAYHYLMQRGHVNAVHFTRTPAHVNVDEMVQHGYHLIARQLPEQAAANKKLAPATQCRIFAIHAQDQDGVKRQSASLARYLNNHVQNESGQYEHTFLRDLATTLSESRSRMPWRSCVLANSMTELRSRLNDVPIPQKSRQDPRVCFVFTGQGAQWAQMGIQLYHKYVVFQNSIDAATRYLKSELDCPWSAHDELFRDAASSRINDPFFSQTLCTVLQVALVNLLSHWGIRPRYVVGHSSGEIAAAYCRGALSEEDAWKVAYYRGLLSSRMLQSFPGLDGAMLAAGISESEAQKLLLELAVDARHPKTTPQLEQVAVVACINSPSSVTLSGAAGAIEIMQQKLEASGKFARRLKVRNAYHSPHMECIAADYVYAIRDIVPKDEQDNGCTMFSAVTGGLIEPWELGPLSWMKNLVSTVRFSEAVQSMLTSGEDIDILVEIGPHSALRSPLNQISRGIGGSLTENIQYVSLLLTGKDAVNSAMSAAGFLYGLGVSVDIGAVNGDQAAGMLVDLPPYAWNHSKSYASISRMETQYQLAEQVNGNTGLLGKPCPTTGEHERKWRGFLKCAKMPWLRDHEIDGAVLFPAAGYIVLAIEAAQRVAEPHRTVESFRLRDVTISAALVVPDDDDIEIVVELRPHFHATRNRTASAVWMEFSISSCVDRRELRENCSGLLSLDYAAPVDSSIDYERRLAAKALEVAHIAGRKACLQEDDDAEFYDSLFSLGLHYGPSFSNISTILQGDGQSCCTVTTQRWKVDDDRLCQPKVIHPGTMDAMFHAVFAAARYQQNMLAGAMVPILIEEIIVSASACSGRDITYTGMATAKRHGLSEMIGDVNMLSTETLEPLVQVRSIYLRAMDSTSANNTPSQDIRHICSKLGWAPYHKVNIDGSKGVKSQEGKEIVILRKKERSTVTSQLCEHITLELSSRGARVREIIWPRRVGSPQLQRESCISLVEIDQPVLANGLPEDFSILQESLLACNSMTWVSRDDAYGSIVPGLSRSIRNEIPWLKLHTMQISRNSLVGQKIERLAGDIVEVACLETADNEFREKDGAIFVPRLTEDHETNVKVSDIANDRDTLKQRQLGEGSVDPVDLSVRNPGNLSSLYFKPRGLDSILLEDDEIEMEVLASGLNFRDVMVAMGIIPDLSMGFESSGVITAVGSAVKRFKVGDRAVSLCHGGHCNLLRNKEMLTQRIPENMSFEAAATLPLVYVTAYNALVRVARARRGQSVLIHAAAGGVGQAAIQIAKHLGLQIYATVGSEDKRSLLRETCGISDDNIFSSRDTSFGMAVRRVTGGRGVDIILNSLAGEILRESWYCLAPFGTFIEIGLKDIQQNSSLDMRPLIRDATFSFFNVSRMIREAPEVVNELLDSTFALLQDGVLKPIEPLTIFPISDIETAFRTMQTGKHRGKMALSWGRDQHVPTLVKCRSEIRLKENATYVLAGGFGGLGRSLANLLVNAGAKHLCFVSRSGGRTADAQSTLARLRSRGVHAWAYQCDLADMESLEPLRDMCSQEHGAPVGGVVQCAMVLQDVPFEKMTPDQWCISLRPKVQGTVNLDRLSSSPSCDFFIVLSSFAGIFGNPSQANYAAACAFQDELAHERRARGQHAVSVDLGIMRDVGYLAEHGAKGHLKEWVEPFGLRESELHALLHLAMTTETETQIITGFATGGTMKEWGMAEQPFYFRDPKFSILACAGLGGENDAEMGAMTGERAKRDDSKELRKAIAGSGSRDEAHRSIVKGLSARVARLLQMNVEDIDVGRPLHAHGVDSLVAVEVRTWLFQDLKANLSIFDLTATAPMDSLGWQIMKRCEIVPEKFKK
ncbi:hypothetical protein BKA67DRAFT_543724 [Truncatella angustata]|uniref:Polyketide synthase n=1 Tax=Truncatella angustata TaxID=152316 RepID=A0A9P8UW60_9PEZI|nr:uncharacterized protein BKA67DRAFT_543724 [Truncatella angustata]KAH6659151.1 hypothetical protein BKA67DRAFT_543724 [Truncatella angustata]